MSRRTGWATDYEKWLSTGRGTGDGSDYHPWLKTTDSSSKAVKTRAYSKRFERFFHFLSHGEFLAYLQYEWNDKTISLKEQYPLDPSQTEAIADELCIRHPSVRGRNVVMTSDLLVSLQRQHDKIETIAIQIKHSERDINDRTYEKLQIEKLYWMRQGVRFALVFSSEFNPVFCKNLQLLYPHRNRDVSRDELEESLYVLLKAKRDHEEDQRCASEMMPALRTVIAHRLMKFPIKEKSLYEAQWKDLVEIKDVI